MLRRFVFQHLGAFHKPCDFQSGFAVGIVFGRRSFSGKTTFMLCYVELMLFSRFVSRHLRASAKIKEIASCDFGALVLCFSAFGAFPLLLVDRLWLPTSCASGSGRAALDQRPFLFILGSPLWPPKWSQGNGRNTEKQMLFVVFSGGRCSGRMVGLECGGPFPSRK